MKCQRIYAKLLKRGEVAWKITSKREIEFFKAKQTGHPIYSIEVNKSLYTKEGLSHSSNIIRDLFKLHEAVELGITIPDEFLEPDENGYLPDGSIKKFWPCWIAKYPSNPIIRFYYGNGVVSRSNKEGFTPEICKPLSRAAIAELDAKGFGITDKMNKLKAEKEAKQ